MKNKYNKIYLFLLIVLILIFLSLILLSTAFKNVSENYSFVTESINVDEISNSIKIGEVNLKNNGILTVRANLNPYLGCVFFDDQKYDFYLDYYGANDLYYGGFRQAYVELSKNEEKTLDIKMNSIRPYIIEKENEPIFPKQITLEIYEMDEEFDVYYEQCANVNRDEVVSKININVLSNE